MNYRKIGSTDVSVSEISFGCWTMGGLNWVNGSPNGWANVDEDEVTAAIKLALDNGVNHFDNADVYGNGKAEQMLYRVLDKLGVKSESVIIATKVGHFPGTATHAYEAAHIRHQCEQSLINLKRDYIDIYYFHHGDFGASDMYLDDAVDVMNSLVADGKVRIKGQSAYSADDFEKLVHKVQPQVFQSWAHALDDSFVRADSRVSKLMEDNNISFVAFSPLAQARLLDKYNPENPPQFEDGDNRKSNDGFKAEAIAALKPKLAKLKERFGDSTEDLVAVALNYILAMPNVACVIPGFRNERQAKINVGASGRTMSAEDVEFVRQTLA